MEILKYQVNDLLELKKPHPCGNKEFKILRVGSIMRIVCTKCGRDMDIDRMKLERATKKIFSTSHDQGDINGSNKQ